MPFKDHEFTGDKNLPRKLTPHSFKIGEPYDSVLRSLPDKSDWLRQAVIDKIKKDGLIK
ncbi:MAG: hypothetical protein KME60_03470 [Cyanomargarita calcarea GSE-NOS-MK-12-04C]|jgi:hypothetical protein|uniref:Uncharacterized protein n=1 Tax=Cyanomargarita calcarea GSE-NOS-MK-12-04C TaxID=2839659 RepID=A0A951QII3_9CYAN|nr:hypothetical protein [Cyanomargarita calcarea GSE-NOS-MK-12-04C]